MSEELTIEYRRLDEVAALRWGRNPKLHDLGALAESIRRHGMIDPPGWDANLNGGKGGLLYGNGRDEALEWMHAQGEAPPRGVKVDEDGMWLIPVKVGVDQTSEAEAEAAALAHNNLVMAGSDFTAYDMARLWSADYTDILASLATADALPITVDGDALDGLLRGMIPEVVPGNGGDDFDTSPSEGPTRCQPGELWAIGPHRLLVGDCTDPANVARLMGGERAQGVFTSPPYAEQRADQYASIPVDKYVEWFSGVAENIKAHLAPDGSFFLNIKPHCEDGERVLYVFDLVLAMRRAWGWRFVDEFCWTRNGFPGGYDNRFKNGFEPVYHFSLNKQIEFRKTNVAERRAPDTHVYGKSGSGSGFQSVIRDTGTGVLPSNVLNIETGEVNIGTQGHPATFPLGLPEFFIRAFSIDGDIWLDPFLGSGTTLVAAHRTGRRCFGMEISPKYCDVILRRASAENLECRLLTE